MVIMADRFGDGDRIQAFPGEGRWIFVSTAPAGIAKRRMSRQHGGKIVQPMVTKKSVVSIVIYSNI